MEPERVAPAASTDARVEAALVARALAGDGRAFADLVRPHLRVLFRVAVRACGDEALAEDAVQETLALIHRDLRRYRVGTSLRAFLAAVAVRRAHSLLRSERRRRRREEASAPRLVGRAEADELVDVERAARRVRAALEQMPRKRREVALLRLDGGLSYEEIAAAVGTTPGSARVLAHRALGELRECLGDLLVQGDEPPRRGARGREP